METLNKIADAFEAIGTGMIDLHNQDEALAKRINESLACIDRLQTNVISLISSIEKLQLRIATLEENAHGNTSTTSSTAP